MNKTMKYLSIAVVSIASLLLSFSAAGQKGEFRKDLIPQPIFESEPGYSDLYWKAWELAWDHVKYQPGLVQPLYMDEGLWDDTIWIWDSEFMVLFCKYAPELFPGIQTLDNFYCTMLEKEESSLRIQHPDNPPFFAWVEWEYFKFTNDREHLKTLIKDKKYLQRYHTLFDNLHPGIKLQFDHAPIAVKNEGIGYRWNGVSSGMDNSPRMRGGDMLWIDAISQQALSALYISRLGESISDKKTCHEFKKKYKRLKNIINEYYWNEKDNCFYDIDALSHQTTNILSPASFWPMLAEVPTKRQARKMMEFCLQPTKLGGKIPWTTISRDDPEFDAQTGHYWKGAIWLPTAYMAIKALEKYNFHNEADETAENVLHHMYKTYCDYTPHTIWECYRPNDPLPSINYGERVREDFCGWSALGPISLYIENVLGFHTVDATERIIEWHLHQTCRHGIQNLRFGGIITDIIYDNGQVYVKSNASYRLVINGKKHHIKSGEQIFSY